MIWNGLGVNSLAAVIFSIVFRWEFSFALIKIQINRGPVECANLWRSDDTKLNEKETYFPSIEFESRRETQLWNGLQGPFY